MYKLHVPKYLDISGNAAKGESQARNGVKWRLLSHRLSNIYGFACTMAKSDSLGALGVSMVIQPHSLSIMLSL